ncbi:MAG: dihydrofolate reductase [Bacteroidota bacterium]
MTQKKQISIIVAIAEDCGIGKDNQLLWHISEDLKRFKRLTSEHTVVMGKKTFYSLPVRPLPKRRNIIITDICNEVIQGCEMAYSIEDAIAKMDNNAENFIMGGASIYRQFFTIANKLYITKVHSKFEADTFFPEINESDWLLIEESQTYTDEKNNLSYTFCTYLKSEK